MVKIRRAIIRPGEAAHLLSSEGGRGGGGAVGGGGEEEGEKGEEGEKNLAPHPRCTAAGLSRVKGKEAVYPARRQRRLAGNPRLRLHLPSYSSSSSSPPGPGATDWDVVASW